MRRESNFSIDSASKSVALVLAVLYLSGFVITSLHNFSYGFSEMNPLRPRILAAGAWFAIFVAIPFVLVWEMRKHSVLTQKSNSFHRLAGFFAAYMGSTIVLTSFSQGLFTFDYPSVVRSTTPMSWSPWWKIAVLVLAAVACILAVLFVIYQMSLNARKWLISVASLLFYSYMAYTGASSAYLHSFRPNSVNLWLMLVGGYVYFEMSRRQWTLVRGDWQLPLVAFFVMMANFATVYYPHIKAQWGGGAAIPIEITFTKEAAVRSGLVVQCSMIDETDSGFYVVAMGSPFATFIPRGEISSIYYGYGNKRSVFSEPSVANDHGH